MREAPDDVVAPRRDFRVRLFVTWKILVARFERFEFIQHAVPGPAGYADEFAHAHEPRQLGHTRQAPARVPREQIIFIRRSGTWIEAPQLYAARETRPGVR